MKTIYALATPLGGAIAIIRISGNKTLDALQKIFTGEIAHSKVSYGKIVSGDCVLDHCMAVFFNAPKSFTGEDMAEVYIHASRAVANSIFDLLSEYGLEPACAGEFSKRAFVNGKMDLAQAEAVMDLLNSSAKRASASALMQLSGMLSKEILEIEDSLVNITAEICAAIDYPDEMEDYVPDFANELSSIRQRIQTLITHGLRSRHIREGYYITIVGKPNVGKSSLLNAITLEDRAIVTQIAGTTRDVIEATADFCGLSVILYDTAGLRDSNDEVESIGIFRTRQMCEKSNMLFVAIDCSNPLTDEDIEVLNDVEKYQAQKVIVACKADLLNKKAREEFKREIKKYNDYEVFFVSSKTNEGINELKTQVAQIIAPSEESGIITNMRHIEALEKVHNAINAAINSPEYDCRTTDIADALRALGEITGSTVEANIVNRIFEKFCVGK
ncbi:MAG: tRNA uridine-5-carboxymethylaminomethyl(34) synthesis GTPase MnmE [Clostridiales bacterium]|nr:tRNA uridine-5-carboxymethylaminomethyl(34) synthesis GTPase MnmE [Clostridiales bacterium]